MPEHTPESWSYAKCDCDFCKGYYVYVGARKIDDLFTEERARFIVRACNAHEDLLAAAQAVIEQECDPLECRWAGLGECEGGVECEVQKLHAAIAKARGKNA